MRERSDHNLRAAADIIAENVQALARQLTPGYYRPALALIRPCVAGGGRLHVTGIGKPAHVAQYAASLLSSMGTPAYFLHGTEAVHGSCGQLVEGDVVICLSNSGETAEMKAAVLAVKNNGCRVIGISRCDDSWLARTGDAHLCVPVEREGGPMNRAPISSVLGECMVLQGLSILLQTERGLTPQEYVRRHPGGALGQMRDGEEP